MITALCISVAIGIALAEQSRVSMVRRGKTYGVAPFIVTLLFWPVILLVLLAMRLLAPAPSSEVAE